MFGYHGNFVHTRNRVRIVGFILHRRAEQGVVNEETPLNGEKALNGEKPNAAKAPLMENEQPTPANSPMEASNVEYVSYFA